MGNGDEASGDGWKYRGRGALQLTGKESYKKFGDIMGLDLVGNPDLLLDRKTAIRSATLYWKSKGINEWADKGDFKKVTLLINGGYIGLEHREKYWQTAKKVLGC
jgi:putative chitinase